ncbi:3,4-dihydroxy-2-butanone-4-phosphate synthase [Rhodococcoides fascians A21d2]|uniref:3,4-dihydroxy-2-butanone-4-phosphate synthase n=1 Tax=Rhodococcoides fascians TaxID=1828 RepID=UPI0009B9030D|nr:3,4-dihydroxy-2-butanone-4-phosphate synthase [Rhodococcus fascians]QII00321.1 3,4-dihydroxy-2-butanone-4-phosphate synthase [Rhodococcus fascians A21d2]
MREGSIGAAAIGAAVAALRAGKPVIVVDDAARENEGDIVVAAQFATEPMINFMISEARGLVCVAASPAIIDKLELAQMVSHNTDNHGTAFTVSVDAITTGTGISASDRAATIRALADSDTRPADLRRPGHVFPLRAVAGGVLERRGHTEAAVALTDLAGLSPAAAICEVLDTSGAAADREYLRNLADSHDMPILTVDEISTAMDGLIAVPTTKIPNRHGTWQAFVHRTPDGLEHFGLILGQPSRVNAPLVRVHSECLTGDVFGSRRCDCGDQLDLSMDMIAAAGAGVVLYLRGHEGRGIGLFDKVRAYSLQEDGYDTVDANVRIGCPVDARSYAPAAAMLRLLKIDKIVLLTNNPDKSAALEANDITVSRTQQISVIQRPENAKYLATKRHRLGHNLDDMPSHSPQQSGHITTAKLREKEGTPGC